MKKPPGRRSHVDQHPQRAEIETLIGRGASLAAIARRFGVSKCAIARHKSKMKRDAPRALVAMAAESWAVKPEEMERLRLETSEGWLRQIRAHHSKCVVVFDRLLEAGSDAIAAQMSAQVLKALAMLGQAVGEISQHSVKVNQNIVVNPSFWRARTAIVQALRPFPEARAAVLEALRRIEGEEPAIVDVTPTRLPNAGQFQPQPLEPPPAP